MKRKERVEREGHSDGTTDKMMKYTQAQREDSSGLRHDKERTSLFPLPSRGI